MTIERYDFVVIGSGPAGQKSAIQAAKVGKRVLIIEREQAVGGECVHRGTIPSKTLREVAVALDVFNKRVGDVFDVVIHEKLQIQALFTRLEQVVRAHEAFMLDQLQRNHVEISHGRAQFVSPNQVQITSPTGIKRIVEGNHIVVAVGSKPRCPDNLPIDHENIFDSDSILSMVYLPRSLTVVGAGVIASEYAAIFSALGVQVTMIDKGDRPVSFLDHELTDQFQKALEQRGSRFIGNRNIRNMYFDGVSTVVTELDDGNIVESEKALVALGRVANLEGLHIEAAGLKASARGLLEINAFCQTTVPHIYAVGDVIGFPSLASAAMEQGRRAVRHALSLDQIAGFDLIPMAIYAIPEMASVGLSENDARKQNGTALVGRAYFHELARGQISRNEDGLLKLVSDPSGEKLLGAHIVGENASELIHIAQVALLSKWSIDAFIENIFNFPTLAEAYRVAALDIAKQRELPQ